MGWKQSRERVRLRVEMAPTGGPQVAPTVQTHTSNPRLLQPLPGHAKSAQPLSVGTS